MSFFQRQISAIDAEGQLDGVPDAVNVPYRLVDVLPKYILKLGEGTYTSDYIRLNANTTFTVPLPAGYTNTSRLGCIFRSNDRCRLTVVSPDHGTSVFLLKSTNGSTDGDHSGIIMWQGTVTSIIVNVPTALVNPALIEYFLYQIPDLADADSYRLGEVALGVVS